VTPRYHPLAMDARSAGRRDLALLATVAVGMTRFADGPLYWIALGLLLVGVALGALQVLGEGEPRGVPIEALALPAIAAVAGAGGLRLLPLGLALVPALAATYVAIDRALALEARLEARTSPPGPDERTTVLVYTLAIAFVAFAGVAAAIPGGLVEPGADPLGRPVTPLESASVALMAGADAIVSFILGYRVSALRMTSVRDATWSALTFAIVIAIAAGAIRALAVPRLLAPALLTLVFFLWDALHGAGSVRRRDPRWLWEIGLLAALGVLIVALNTRLAT
jgi:hypothetical protein